jgi:hypothetical protein
LLFGVSQRRRRARPFSFPASAFSTEASHHGSYAQQRVRNDGFLFRFFFFLAMFGADL